MIKICDFGNCPTNCDCHSDDRREIGRLKAEVEGKARELDSALIASKGLVDEVLYWKDRCANREALTVKMQQELDGTNLQNGRLKDILNGVRGMLSVATAKEVGSDLVIRILRRIEAGNDPSVENRVGACTRNAVEAEYSTGHTICLKPLPCPTHDIEKRKCVCGVAFAGNPDGRCCACGRPE